MWGRAGIDGIVVVAGGREGGGVVGTHTGGRGALSCRRRGEGEQADCRRDSSWWWGLRLRCHSCYKTE